VKSVDKIGSIRSTRFNFTDIAKAYNSVMIYSGGSGVVLDDMAKVGIDNIAADIPVGYRDTDRSAAGYSLEHTLFAKGESIWNAAVDRGFDTEISHKDYGMRFAEEGTPANGAAASEIEIDFTLRGVTKKTVMKYDAARDKYIYNQYGKEMRDQITDELEGFTNVIIMQANITNNGIYHAVDFVAQAAGDMGGEDAVGKGVEGAVLQRGLGMGDIQHSHQIRPLPQNLYKLFFHHLGAPSGVQEGGVGLHGAKQLLTQHASGLGQVCHVVGYHQAFFEDLFNGAALHT
jgi:hypothetical protein